MSKISVFEGCLWAPRRAPIARGVLALIEMKSLVKLKALRTLNQAHISKIHEDGSNWNLIATARARTTLKLENAHKILIKFALNLISHFDALKLFQVSLDQRVLKLNLSFMKQNAFTFQSNYNGRHVVRAWPSAEALKSGKISKNHRFWAKTWIFKGIYDLLGARLCLGVHWNWQKWKALWI